MDPIGGDEEINKALREFEEKERTEQAASPIRKEESSPEESKMVGFIIRHSGGLIKDQRRAEYTLLVFIVITLGVSFYLFFGGNGGEPSAPLPPPLEAEEAELAP